MAWVLSGTGAACAIIGASQAKKDIFAESGDGVIAPGIATLATIAGVAFFIAAAKKNRRPKYC